MHTLILGFDSFDPTFFEILLEQGKLPNLEHYVKSGKYARFTVSDPPQTEVSWTSIATGANPGVHGIFDFVHRDPANYTPYVSLLPTQRNKLGNQFIPPHQANTIFLETAAMGYPSTSLWWPATFPARPESPVRTIPGLGAPDLLGRLGVGAFFTTDPDYIDRGRKTPIHKLKPVTKNRFTGQLVGPEVKPGQNVQVEFFLDLAHQDPILQLGNQKIILQKGKWSPIFEIDFKLSFFFKVKALTRVLLVQTESEPNLYFLPLQVHPLSSTYRYATPPGFIKEIWNACGPYLTLGWPQDTTGLEEGYMSDDQFLQLCDGIFAGRECVLMHQLQNFKEGLLGIIFDDLDRIQHMFRRDQPQVVEAWYQKLDALVGRVEKSLHTINPKARLLILSDHGFSDFTYKIHLNRWLIEQGFLTPMDRNGLNSEGSLLDVDWSQSQAYAIGLNSLYLNLNGREGKGSLDPASIEPVLGKLRNKLLALHGPDGKAVFSRVLLKHEAFQGPLTPYGPDLVLGYAPGYRASSETGLGKWSTPVVCSNQDHWGADHCINSLSVPGVIMSNLGLHGMDHPTYTDIPLLTIGKPLKQAQSSPPPPPSIAAGEDQEKLEERLKSLGYL